MSDIIMEDAAHVGGVKVGLKRPWVLLRALLYFAIAVGVCAILPAAKEVAGLTAVILEAGFCLLLLLVLFIHENVNLYRSSRIYKWKKFAAIDMCCICIGMLYWFLAHALWYKKGEVRFYDAIILAVLALPYIYRVYRIFGLPKPQDGKEKQAG